MYNVYVMLCVCIYIYGICHRFKPQKATNDQSLKMISNRVRWYYYLWNTGMKLVKRISLKKL